jgi:hypothetical protein
MATKNQYDCFRAIFDCEEARYDRLAQRATLYLSVNTLYLGLLAVAADKIIPQINANPIAISVYLASFAAFVVSLTFLVLAMGIYKYVYPTDPVTVVMGVNPDWPIDAVFFDDRIVELAAAFRTNHAVNERRASLLKRASFSMLVGIVLQAVVLSMLLFIQHD